MAAYYNENDPFAAAWLRNLIGANMIAPGDVDERSIEDVVPVDLAKYVQCHFFAGIGVWSYAMRRAGWPDDRPGWSGSCPCQPFSQAGEGAGFADKRHLWPAFFHLIEQCRPVSILGEQVASPNGLAWLDLVQSDMEGTNYAFGAHDCCAAGFGAPHIRQRLYWVAYNADSGWQSRRRPSEKSNGGDTPRFKPRRFCTVSRLADNNNAGLEGRNERRDGSEQFVAWPYSMDGGLEHTAESSQHGWSPVRQQSLRHQRDEQISGGRPGSTNGYWRAVDWLRCKDERWRPVEPGSFPLAHGITNRMGLLRGCGNAIIEPQAEEFVKAFLEYAP